MTAGNSEMTATPHNTPEDERMPRHYVSLIENDSKRKINDDRDEHMRKEKQAIKKQRRREQQRRQ